MVWHCSALWTACDFPVLLMKASIVQDYTASEVERLESTPMAELCRLTGHKQ